MIIYFFIFFFINIINPEPLEINTIKKRISNRIPKRRQKNKKLSKIAKKLKRLKAKKTLKNITLLQNKNNTEIIIKNEECNYVS